MKTKLFISMLFCSYALTSYAQTISPTQTDKCPQTDNWKMQRWSIGVNINTVEPITEAGFMYIVSQPSIFNDATTHRKDKSYSLGLNIFYKIKDNCMLRLSARMIQYKIDERYDERETIPSGSSDYILDTAHISESVYSISPGILWNFNYKKLNLYGGFQLVYKKYSPTAIDIRYAFYDASNALSQGKYYIIKESGGYSLGVGPVAGFSVNLFKGFSIGAEFSSSYTYYKRGGETSSFLQFTYPVSIAGNNGTTTSHGSYEAYKFSSIVSSINIFYNF